MKSLSKNQLVKALVYGVLAALFFAFTFIFNRSMNLDGGDWMWSASLRYLFSLPILFVFLKPKEQTQAVYQTIQKRPKSWLIWSTVGFGLFYGPLTLASLYGSSWFIATSWQLTILCGLLLTPLFGKSIPVKNIMMSLIILLGVFLIQLPYLYYGLGNGFLIALLCIILAAIAYPLGNRKMLALTKSDGLSTSQRVYGMTLMSMPFWLCLSIAALIRVGLPTWSQVGQSIIVALFSGVIATLLFFEATNLVKDNHKQLAVVEATQAGEVIFTLIFGCLLLGDAWPNLLGWLGIALIVMGIIANSLLSSD
ncbi:DMT family transporter [Streptococcus loxodontisalivarius]|uniref:Drug/metabolite transporter (DMT)-like permease n=1 Tax=Streptococcus loxodontisalivarius TaxID=1349415 RepID=A0ABS2PSF9_9STRE|nr:multidrug resistance efflux transporter family protein [Streptococcus loxodontisalivarius]MBM7642974.1 drug/metabolite transporter (DMT)-like permease [Streptococcus loxodontisalivarius]